MPGNDIAKKWYTVAEVAQMLGFGLSKTKMLVAAHSFRQGRPPSAHSARVGG
jgi:hypothetical protein